MIKIEKLEKLVTSLHYKTKYVIHKRNLKQALIHGYEYQAKKKNRFEKKFFKLMNIVGFGKTMENLRKHRDIKLVTI